MILVDSTWNLKYSDLFVILFVHAFVVDVSGSGVLSPGKWQKLLEIAQLGMGMPHTEWNSCLNFNFLIVRLSKLEIIKLILHFGWRYFVGSIFVTRSTFFFSSFSPKMGNGFVIRIVERFFFLTCTKRQENKRNLS